MATATAIIIITIITTIITTIIVSTGTAGLTPLNPALAITPKSSGEHADVFDLSCVLCHEDIIDKYGAVFAAQLAADRFAMIYDQCGAAGNVPSP